MSECYYFHENCFLMGTIAKACLQGSDLLVQQHFRWVQLRWDGEPMQPIVGRGALGDMGLVLSFNNRVASGKCSIWIFKG